MKALAAWLGVVLLAGVRGAPSTQGERPTAAPPHGGLVFRGGVTPLSLSLPEVVQRSQFVLKGEITAAGDEQTVSVPYKETVVRARVCPLTFRVDRTIKGEAPVGDVASFSLYYGEGRGPLWGHLGGPFVPGWYGLLFLTTAEDGRLIPTDFVYPGVEISLAPAPTATSPGAMGEVEAELINTLLDTGHARMESAAELLVGLHHRVDTARAFGPPDSVIPLDRESLLGTLQVVADSTDPILSGTAVAALLRLGDLSRLREAVAFVNAYGPPPGANTERVLAPKGTVARARFLILLAIGGLDDDAAAPMLNQLLLNPDSLVRQEVSHALRRICSVSSMPSFAAALDDPDPYVSGSAISGLACAYQRARLLDVSSEEYRQIRDHLQPLPDAYLSMLPNEEEYQRDPEPYREWWKDWWEATGRTAYEKAASAGGT